MKLKTCLLTLLLSISVNTVYGADLFEIKDKEIPGAALLNLLAKKEIVSRSLAYCSSLSDEISESNGIVLSNWIERNAIYLPLGPILMQELKSKFLEEGTIEAWEEIEKKSFNAMINMIGNQFVEYLKLLPDNELAIEMCKDISAAIDNGKYDHQNESPRIKIYIDYRLEQAKKN